MKTHRHLAALLLLPALLPLLAACARAAPVPRGDGPPRATREPQPPGNISTVLPRRMLAFQKICCRAR